MSHRSHRSPMSQASQASPASSPPSAARPTRADILARLAREDAVGQLRRHAGTMLRLGSENGIPMLDWVDAVPRLLADSAQLDVVERDARQLVARGIRHVVWAGMGGSVLTVQVLCALGYCDELVRIHPLDSTDPRALNRLLQRLAEAKGITLPASVSQAQDTAGQQERQTAMPAEDALCRALLADVVMVGVAMGKTSEEPISHLDWFGELLRHGGLAAAEHLLAMSIPDSYLERYAHAHGIPSLQLQLDGGAGTPGRMSAPATRVFLLPVAIDLAARGAAPGTLRSILARAWAAYDLDGAGAYPEQHPFVRLAATLASAATDGACALSFALPPELDALRWWTEQLMEESLGKDGKGVVVFANKIYPAAMASSGSLGPFRPLSSLRLRLVPEAAPAGSDGTQSASTTSTTDRSDDDQAADVFTIYQPLLAGDRSEDHLAGLAATMLGLQLSMVLYGYLNDIPFVGQPAVEAYKARARALRAGDDPVRAAEAATAVRVDGRIRLLPPPDAASTTATTLAMSPLEIMADALAPHPTYVDLTINGEIPEKDVAALENLLRQLGLSALGVPVKLRRAPASYHSTEQSEMDGPPGLVSLRALAEQSDSCLLGTYDARFLRAQAVGTWLAMNEQRRACYLLVHDGTSEELGPALCQFLATLARRLASPSEASAR